MTVIPISKNYFEVLSGKKTTIGSVNNFEFGISIRLPLSSSSV